MNSITSIYIPRMSVIHTEESVINVMFNLRIGTVSRVDFIPINKKPGFVEKFDDVYKSAFVHFYLPLPRYEGPPLPAEDTAGLCLRNQYIWDMLDTDEPCRVKVSPNEYWFILQNKNPVSETMMNIHQVVENGRHLEGLIEKQNKKLEEQDTTIKKLETKLDGVHALVYQLIGGLFNQGNQRDILEEHFKCLFPETIPEYTEDALPEKNKWTIYPTTRQGDECERRVEALEQQIRDMLKFDFHDEPSHHYEEDYEEEAELLHRCNVNYIEPREHHYEDHYDEEELLHRCNINYIYNDASSTHSSMPDLVDDDASTTTHSSMPELIDVNSLETGERIRNSYELCGNE
jgi:hypothetical protein